ncbi:MAG TPA: RidA family protein [Actinomycetota bacterium]|nr:RidA family protein [Actinomycetota bacterium]
MSRGEGPPETPHRFLNPPSLSPPRGFSHAVVAAPGRLVFVAGQAGHRPDGSLVGDSLVAQFDRACANVVEALAAAGAGPEHLVSVQVFVTDAAAYRGSLEAIGEAWRRHFGRRYPAVSLFEVGSLFDPEARVELVAVAVVPEAGGATGRAPGR